MLLFIYQLYTLVSFENPYIILKEKRLSAIGSKERKPLKIKLDFLFERVIIIKKND